MGSIELCAIADIRTLVSRAYEIDEPIVVSDSDDDCLVVMKPSVFERILFDSDLLNWENRESMRF